MNTLGHYTLHLRKEHADVFRLQAHAAAWASPVTGTAEHRNTSKCSVEEASCKEILEDFPTVIKPQPQTCLLCCHDASSPHIGDPCKAPSLLLQTRWHRWPPKRCQGHPCLAAGDQDGAMNGDQCLASFPGGPPGWWSPEHHLPSVPRAPSPLCKHPDLLQRQESQDSSDLGRFGARFTLKVATKSWLSSLVTQDPLLPFQHSRGSCSTAPATSHLQPQRAP